MRATRCPPKALRKRLESMCRVSVTFPDAGFYATTYVTTRAGPCRAHMTRGFLANARPTPLAEGVAPLGRPSLLAVREEPGRFPGRTIPYDTCACLDLPQCPHRPGRPGGACGPARPPRERGPKERAAQQHRRNRSCGPSICWKCSPASATTAARSAANHRPRSRSPGARTRARPHRRVALVGVRGIRGRDRANIPSRMACLRGLADVPRHLDAIGVPNPGGTNLIRAGSTALPRSTT